MKFWMTWLLLLVVPAIGYVGWRTAAARRRGEDASAASVRALGEALPVLGAGIAGLVLFMAVVGIALVLLFIFVIASIGHNETGGLGSVIVALFALGGVALIGLPVTAFVLVVRRRRRREGR